MPHLFRRFKWILDKEGMEIKKILELNDFQYIVFCYTIPIYSECVFRTADYDLKV